VSSGSSLPVTISSQRPEAYCRVARRATGPENPKTATQLTDFPYCRGSQFCGYLMANGLAPPMTRLAVLQLTQPSMPASSGCDRVLHEHA
jgi:hypothetical protein